MKRNTIRTVGIIGIIGLLSLSCMLFQPDRRQPHIEDAPFESEQEESASPASEVEAPEEEEGEVIHQWAVSATASSSYGDPDWGATQATGQPNTNGCVDEPTAWASEASTGVDWLELRYEKPVYPKKINIVQTHSPNQVTKVDLISTDGDYYTVYSRDPEVRECPFTLTLSIADTDYQVIGIKLTIDQSILDPTSWNEIDAVELVGRYVGGEVADMPPADSPPDGPPAAEVPTGDFELPDMSPSDLSPGTFQYVIAGMDGADIVEEGTIQDQSTSDEYVIGFVSQDFKYSLTLFLPHDISAGPLPLIPYDSSSFSKGPSGTIYMKFDLFVADGGLVMLDAVDDTITGSFVFVAHGEDDPSQIVSVSGVFNQIPLVSK
jgi:hypothetical protein